MNRQTDQVGTTMTIEDSTGVHQGSKTTIVLLEKRHKTIFNIENGEAL